MKRKAGNAEGQGDEVAKKQATETDNVYRSFRSGLFDPEIVRHHAVEYSNSIPYKHAVVREVIDDVLLRAVRSEIQDNVQFTPKETDIYKIHQSGDLANLDGLPASSLDKLPSLLKLRDALYSQVFRQWISSVSGAGALSGRKTDMAVNVYVPGCHLLCHDDVIGSRRVSYILYLTDPDDPWQAHWGGALRLYPTDQFHSADGKTILLPKANWSKSIPPAWNQLSFFAVQPGESFHDVEEVYHRSPGVGEHDGGRIRMAISGWFHIPQAGEEGFEPGLEASLAEKSSLQQLQGKADDFDEPQSRWTSPDDRHGDLNGEECLPHLTEDDLGLLINFMTPHYLTPDTVEELNELFTEESVLHLTDFLSAKFSASLRNAFDSLDPADKLPFSISRPPHKHRHEFLQSQAVASTANGTIESPFRQILDVFLPSLAFRKWLSLVSGLNVKRSSVLARRFRRGLDYQLAQGYEGDNPQIEYTLCVTPTDGWTAGEEVQEVEGCHESAKKAGNGEDDNPGGYELYMAGDDLDEEEQVSEDGIDIPANLQSHTGAGQRRCAKSRKADPAIYQAGGDDEDDGILFVNPASWNTMSIVLRDKGTLRFVKYVSQSAPGDRFDYSGCVEVELDEDDEEIEGGASKE